LIGELNFGSSASIFIPKVNNLGTLTIENGISIIGVRCFEDAQFSGDLVLPDSVKLIDDNAFRSFGYTEKSPNPARNLTLANAAQIGYDSFNGANFNGILTLGNYAEKNGSQTS
jgi:hypothetical protein